MGKPFVQSMVKPRAMVSMASVATNGGTLNLVMVQPLNKPISEPTISPASMQPNMVKPMYKLAECSWMPLFNNPAAIAPQSASMEPTERSIPAISITMVMPTEMQMFTDICRITFQVLSTVKNLSDIKLMPMHSNTSAMSD